MANEITETVALSLNNGNLKDNIVLETKQITQSTQWSFRDVLSIPTTAGGTVISTTGITALGWCYVKNLDATNFVKLGPTSGGAIIDMIKLKPGEFCLFRLMTGITLRAISDTAACKILIVIYDD